MRDLVSRLKSSLDTKENIKRKLPGRIVSFGIFTVLGFTLWKLGSSAGGTIGAVASVIPIVVGAYAFLMLLTTILKIEEGEDEGKSR